MNIDDGRIFAPFGDMLAEGEFRFEGKEAAGFLPAPDAMIAIQTKAGLHGTQFHLVPNARRDADGLWSADQQVHALSLSTTLPALDKLLEFPSFALSSEGMPSNRTRFDLTTEHSAFAWVAVDTVFGVRESLLGNAAAGSIDVRRDADGFEFLIEARVDEPKRREVRAPPFTVRVRARLSFATLALAGSPLWWRGGPDCWSEQAIDQWGPLAEVLTLDRAGGTPYFRGTLDLGAGQPEYSRRPWVKAWVSEHQLRLSPHGELRASKGFVSGNNNGPDLIFQNLGSVAWKAMLADGDEAVLEQSGAGIGHVEGVTGRSAYDDGPHEQPISRVRTRLSRSDQGLRIRFDGEFGEMRQKPSQPALGPEFHGDFLVPTAFLFARGIWLRDQWAERRKRLGQD